MMKRAIVFMLMMTGLFAWSGQGHAHDFQITVVSARILPTKKDRRCWDVCMAWDHGGLFRLSRQLQQRKGLKAWRQIVNTVGATHLLRGPKMPDPYAILRFSNGQIIKTKAISDTLHPRWGSKGRVSLRKGDALEVEVWDQDLRNDDLIGRYPTQRIPAHILAQGGTWRFRFDQVYEFTIAFAKVASPSGGLFVPGLYEVTVLHASIHHMRKDGKPWDVFQGKPDPFVILRFGKHKITTPVEDNTLRPQWNYTERVYLNGNEAFQMDIWDKDLRNHDLIGTCRYRTIAELPLDPKGRYRSQCFLAKEITIQLTKIR